MKQDQLNVLYYGADQPLPEQIALRAGPLSLIYEAGDLRYIRLGEREIVRRVYVALRDHNWETVRPALANVRLEHSADAFQLSYDATNRQGAIDFAWRATITGDTNGTITFALAGQARMTFLRNRIGFCVLHPMHECAGARCWIEHVDGTSEESVFPHYIAPQSIVDGRIQPVHPFSEMRAMAHEVRPDIWAEVRFAGEIFEMEDQRNWTDASFKTYGTPLRLPFPAEIARGTRIAQSITLTLQEREPRTENREPRTENREPRAENKEQRTQNKAPRTENREPRTENQQLTTDDEQLTTDNEQLTTDNEQLTTDNEQLTTDDGQLTTDDGQLTTDNGQLTTDTGQQITFILDSMSDAIALPRIGLGVASHGQPLSEREIERLRVLKLGHLRVDLELSQAGWVQQLRQAAAEAQAIGVPLELALLLSDAAATELRSLADALNEIKPLICTWLIFHTREKVTGAQWVNLAREQLASYDPTTAIGAGTNVYFTDLNCQRPPIDALDLVAYSINPQVHAFDNASLAETLAAQAVTVASARQFTGDRPLAITPITLLPRFNPNATGPAPALAPGELPPQVDARQMSLFGAGWTLGSLAFLCPSSAASLTYYETSGWRGVLETASGSPLPDRFRSLPGAVFPLYHVLADVGEFAGGAAIPTQSSDPLRVIGLALQKDGVTCVLLANLGPAAQPVRVHHGSRWASIRTLDATNAEAAMHDPEAFRAQAGTLVEAVGGETELELLPFAIARIDLRAER